MRARVCWPTLHSTLNSALYIPIVSARRVCTFLRLTSHKLRPLQNVAPMSTFIGDRPEQLDVASLRLPTDQIEFELGPPFRQEAWPTELRKVLLSGPFRSSWRLNSSLNAKLHRHAYSQGSC